MSTTFNKTVSSRLSEADYNKFCQEANSHNLSLNKYFRQILISHLNGDDGQMVSSEFKVDQKLPNLQKDLENLYESISGIEEQCDELLRFKSFLINELDIEESMISSDFFNEDTGGELESGIDSKEEDISELEKTTPKGEKNSWIFHPNFF